MGEVEVLAGERCQATSVSSGRRGRSHGRLQRPGDPGLPAAAAPAPTPTPTRSWWINEGAPAAFAAGGERVRDRRPDDRPASSAASASATCATGPARSATGSHRWARARGRHRRLPDADRRTRSPTACSGWSCKTEQENTASQRVAHRRRVHAGGRASGAAGAAATAAGTTSSCGPGWTATAGDPVPAAAARPARPPGDRPGPPHRRGDHAAAAAGLPDAPDHPRRPQPPRGRGHLRPAERRRTWPAIERRCAQAAARWLAGERADFTIRDAASDEYAGEIGLYYWGPGRPRR